MNDSVRELEYSHGTIGQFSKIMLGSQRVKMCKIKTRHESSKNGTKITNNKVTDTDLFQYFSLLTPYAFDYVKKKQFEIKTKVLSSTTVNVCGCRFYVAMKLPCRHIFYLRSTKDITLYKEKLCSVH